MPAASASPALRTTRWAVGLSLRIGGSGSSGCPENMPAGSRRSGTCRRTLAVEGVRPLWTGLRRYTRIECGLEHRGELGGVLAGVVGVRQVGQVEGLLDVRLAGGDPLAAGPAHPP